MPTAVTYPRRGRAAGVWRRPAEEGWEFLGSAIENSLRRALAKGDGSDPDFRLQIYEAAERALLRLEADRDMAEEAKERHRRELIAAIESIEGDFADGSASFDGPAEGSSSDADAAPRADDGAAAAPKLAAAPGTGRAGTDRWPKDATADDRTTGEPSSDELAEPNFAGRERLVDDEDGSQEEEDDAGSHASRRRPRLLVTLVITLLLVFLVGAAVWMVLPFFSSRTVETTGQSEAGADGGLSVAEAIRENTDTAPTQDAAPAWLDVYTPAALREFAASDAAITDVAPAGEQPRLQLTAPSDGPAAEGETGTATTAGVAREIELPMAGDVARQFAGKKVEGEIVVGSPDGKPRTFTLRCLFGGETVCGRQRFTTALPEENFLFHLEFPPEAVTGGQIALDPSVGADGKDLMFFGLKLRNAS